jgi:arsenate reductase
VYNVLFLCTGNSARSVMAEAQLNHRGAGRFRAFSAGSHPTGRVNPLTLRTLEMAGLPTADLRSKSWDEFAAPGAPKMDFVFTVCDNAAGEVCPVWPGQPMTAHWGFADPAAFEGPEAEALACFKDIFLQIGRRIDIFCNLRLEALDRLAIKGEIDRIGRE